MKIKTSKNLFNPLLIAILTVVILAVGFIYNASIARAFCVGALLFCAGYMAAYKQWLLMTISLLIVVFNVSLA
jgi:hypothetical protein